jgi:hypothetical protein
MLLQYLWCGEGGHPDTPRALYRCPNAVSLCRMTTQIWDLPTNVEMNCSSSLWFRSLLSAIPPRTIYATLLV